MGLLEIIFLRDKMLADDTKQESLPFCGDLSEATHTHRTSPRTRATLQEVCIVKALRLGIALVLCGEASWFTRISLGLTSLFVRGQGEYDSQTCIFVLWSSLWCRLWKIVYLLCSITSLQKTALVCKFVSYTTIGFSKRTVFEGIFSGF